MVILDEAPSQHRDETPGTLLLPGHSSCAVPCAVQEFSMSGSPGSNQMEKALTQLNSAGTSAADLGPLYGRNEKYEWSHTQYPLNYYIYYTPSLPF